MPLDKLGVDLIKLGILMEGELEAAVRLHYSIRDELEAAVRLHSSISNAVADILDKLPSWALIVYEIRRRIDDGVYLPGERIPSTADLAKEFEVSLGTVRKAHEHLVNQDVLTTKGMGYRTFVRSTYRPHYTHEQD